MVTQAASIIADPVAPTILGIAASAPTEEEAQALAIFNGLADGHIDRKLFTDYCNAYFNQQTIDDLAASLNPLRSPLSFKQTKEGARGGTIFRLFAATFPDRELKVTTYDMPDRKLEQYLVIRLRLTARPS